MSDEQKGQQQSQPARSGRRLYRSRRERMIGGVCGGLAEYFGIDPTIVRIALVVLAFVAGWGIIAYIIGLIIIPENPEQASEESVKEESPSRSAGLIWGALFIIAGSMANVGVLASLVEASLASGSHLHWPHAPPIPPGPEGE
ncbi:MAG: PspC domain-containing protein [bacterium]